MRKALPTLLLAAGASTALAGFAVLIYNNWYFAGTYWPRWLLLVLLLTPGYALLLHGAWRGLWRGLAWYWLALMAAFMLGAPGFDQSRMSFGSVMNLEVPMLWVPVVWIAIYAWRHSRASVQPQLAEQRRTARSLELRRKLRRSGRPLRPAHSMAATAILEFQQAAGPPEDAMPYTDMQNETATTRSLEMQAEDAPAEEAGEKAPPRFKLLSLLLALGLGLAFTPQQAQAEGVDSTEPWTRPDRHSEFKDESLRWDPQSPGAPDAYPPPLTARARETFYIVVDNRADGLVRIYDKDGGWHTIGKVLAPVRKINPAGFTASGWAAPGTLCATSVNALHIKTGHDYGTGKSSLFSLLPVEFAEFDPKNYKSYFSATASLVTDLPAGSGIFGGQWAPLVNSKVYVGPPGWDWSGAFESGSDSFMPEGTKALAEGYAPAEGDVYVIAVARHKYNPEWIEFENRFGGIIWVKELGLDPYPVGQVLKPVAGAGRFGGSLYAGRGRIRANHPGVICISTSEDGAVGGFQIIPRDHSMSSEMANARTKTQWMVVGPLWAFDPSWEGLPPLFTDYLYPANIPLSGKLEDGTEVSGAEVFLGRATIRARYSDSPTPGEYELLRATAPLTFEALKNMTHLRIYFPRG